MLGNFTLGIIIIVLELFHWAQVDIWAIGCDCYEMGTSKYAFEGRNGTELMEAIKRNQARELLF